MAIVVHLYMPETTAPIPFNDLFYLKLKEVSESVGLSAEDMLLIMYLESRFEVGNYNRKSGAAGLTQLIPSVLVSLGFKGTKGKEGLDFSRLDAVKQLTYIEKFFKQNSSIDSPAKAYLYNMAPGFPSLPKYKNATPATVIARKDNPRSLGDITEAQMYEGNYKEIDVNRDGVITYGDIIAKVEKLSKEEPYLSAVKAYYEAINNPENQKVKINDELKANGFLEYLDKEISNLSLIFKNAQSLSQIPNNLLETYRANRGIDFSSRISQILQQYKRTTSVPEQAKIIARELNSDPRFKLGDETVRTINGVDYLFANLPDHYGGSPPRWHSGISVFPKRGQLEIINTSKSTKSTKIPKSLLDEFKVNSGESYVSTINNIIKKYNRTSELPPKALSIKQNLESDSNFLLGHKKIANIGGKEYLFIKTPDHYSVGDQFSHPGVDAFVLSKGFNREFYSKLDQISKQANIPVKDLLTVFYLESGINTNQIGYLQDKSGNLTIFGGGLNQIIPSQLPNYFEGTIKDYVSLPPEKQLEYVGQFFIKSNARKSKMSPAMVYINNFLPGSVNRPIEGQKIKSNDPSGILAQKDGTYVYPDGLKESWIYRDNAGLDYDKDGKITLGDIQSIVANKSNSGKLKKIYSEYLSHSVKSDSSAEGKTPSNYLSSLQKELDDLLRRL